MMEGGKKKERKEKIYEPRAGVVEENSGGQLCAFMPVQTLLQNLDEVEVVAASR